MFALAQDGDSLPDAWADNVLTMDEIQANPSSNVILGQLARSVARMHGLADATVRIKPGRAFGRPARLELRVLRQA